MVVKFISMDVDFINIDDEDTAVFHAGEIIFHDVDDLSHPYVVVDSDLNREIPLYSIRVD